jgi:hypothetical protein
MAAFNITLFQCLINLSHLEIYLRLTLKITLLRRRKQSDAFTNINLLIFRGTIAIYPKYQIRKKSLWLKKVAEFEIS